MLVPANFLENLENGVVENGMAPKHVNQVQVPAQKHQCVQLLRDQRKSGSGLSLPDRVQQHQKTGKVGEIPEVSKQVPPHVCWTGVYGLLALVCRLSTRNEVELKRRGQHTNATSGRQMRGQCTKSLQTDNTKDRQGNRTQRRKGTHTQSRKATAPKTKTGEPKREQKKQQQQKTNQRTQFENGTCCMEVETFGKATTTLMSWVNVFELISYTGSHQPSLECVNGKPPRWKSLLSLRKPVTALAFRMFCGHQVHRNSLVDSLVDDDSQPRCQTNERQAINTGGRPIPLQLLIELQCMSVSMPILIPVPI